MNNPCKGCIVDPMCRETCERFERWVCHVINKDKNTSLTYFATATRIRRGIYKIDNGDIVLNTSLVKKYGKPLSKVHSSKHV